MERAMRLLRLKMGNSNPAEQTLCGIEKQLVLISRDEENVLRQGQKAARATSVSQIHSGQNPIKSMTLRVNDEVPVAV